ncbi:MAG: hypothetical protein A2046_09375 [Bacteroidetes bacterium GWA2_30_7]|nr:MAG: hypothetical protein A2046_09375 [Bacteroidetes bacterium GWA2_30_7]
MKAILLLIFICTTCNVFSQSIQIVNGITPEVLVQDTFVNGCVNASNIFFTGQNIQISYFNKSNSNFPFKSGILLTTGDYNEALGPNSQTGAGTSLTPGPGDSNLDAIATDNTNDASVLEFDFTPSSDTINFRYIFASEEYDEYVNSSYNDIFAFFLTGPNPAGGNYVNKNIALIPGTTTAVSINNVNNGYTSSGVPTGPCENCAYYQNNLNGQSVEYDAFTKALIATAVVVPCSTYHIKIAVADVSDHALDSGVFLEAGSFSSGGQIAMNNFSQVGDNNSLYEGCENYYVFSRLDSSASALNDSVEVVLSYSGTALQGVDISTTDTAYFPYFPTSFWISAGQIYDTLYYTAHNDSIEENDEYLVLTLLSGCPCNMNAVTDTIFIYDVAKIKGGIQDMDNAFCNETAPDSIMIFAQVNIANPSYVWSTGENGDTIYVPPITGRTMYSVTISDPCGNEILDSIPIIIGNFAGINVDVQQPQCNNVCNGSINVTTNGGANPFSYNWIPNGTSTNGSADSLCSGGYKVTVTDSLGCKYFTSTPVTLINPASLSSSSYITNTTIKYCNGTGTNISINTTTDISSIQYLWNTGETTSSIVVNPSNGNNTYWVQFQDICGNIFTDNITINASNMIAPSVTTTNVLCYNTCTGTSNVTTSGGVTPYTYQWYPAGTGSSDSGIANSLCAGNYNVTLSDAVGCSKTASFSITQLTDLISSVTSTNSNCFSSCDGTATVVASGATSPYSYIWSSSSIGNTDTADSLCSGNYSVTITDSNNCAKVKTFSISKPTDITSSLVTTNSKCYNSCDGAISVVPTGGIPPYSYSWNPSNIGTSASGSATSLCSGNYSVSITDANNCIKSNIFTITEPSEIILTTNVLAFDSVSCNGSASVSATGGTSPYSYLWNDTTNATTQQVNSLCKGTYTITVTDANNCSKQTTVTIYQTSIDENDYSQYFTIYPNPTHDGNINLKLNGIQPKDVKIRLYDITGKQILIENIKEQSEIISLGNIPSGVYNLNVAIKDKEFNQRVVVNR